MQRPPYSLVEDERIRETLDVFAITVSHELISVEAVKWVLDGHGKQFLEHDNAS